MTFDLYLDLDATDDGGCNSDYHELLLKVGNGAAQPISGDTCAADTTSSNPMGNATGGVSQQMTFDLSYAIGSDVELSFSWANDNQNDAGLGPIINDVQPSCGVP